jgi:hypothetical protein
MVFLVRRIPALLVTLALTAGNVGLCAGWLPTAEARMACCAENDSCPMHKPGSSAEDVMRVVSQADADRCCASSSTDDSAPSPAAFAFTSPLAIVASPVPFVLPEPQTYHQFWRSLVPSPPTDVARHVLLSVFLI